MSSESLLFDNNQTQTNNSQIQSDNENNFLFPITGSEEQDNEIELTTEPVEPVVNNESTESDTNIESISSEDNESFLFPTSGIDEEVSTLDKLEYGWDKNQWVVGNMWKTGSNYIESLFDSDKSFQEVTLENEAERLAKFEEEHWKMLDGKNDGVYTFIGEAASFVTDPYYLAGYFFGRGMLASPLSSAMLNGALIGGDNLFEQLAKTGTVDYTQLSKAAGTGAAIGAVMPYGGKLLQKYLPNAMKSKVDEVTAFMDKKIAKVNGVTPQELATIRTAAKSSNVQKVTNKLDDLVTSKSWQSTSSNQAALLNQAEKRFIDLRSKLSKDAFDINKRRKDILKPIKDLTKKNVGSKTYYENVIRPVKDAAKAEGKKILDIRLQIKEANKAWVKQSADIKARTFKRLERYYKLEGERTAAIIAELDRTAGLGTKVLKSVLSNLTRPLVGAGIGAAANVSSGALGFDVEDDFWGWVTAGAALGFGQKAIQKSIKIPLGQKDVYGKVIENHATRFAFQKLRELTAGTVATKLNSFGGSTQKIARLLFRQVDDTMSNKSVIAQADSMDTYFLRKANNMIANSTPEMQSQAVSIIRGNKALGKVASKEVLDLATNLQSWMDEFKILYNKAGFFSPKELDNYFPRVLNWEVINSNRPAAEKIFTQIFKDNYKMSTEKARKSALDYLTKSEGPGISSVVNQRAWNNIVRGSQKGTLRPQGRDGTIADSVRRKAGDEDLIYTPVSDHITKQRSLQGKFEMVEDVLEKNGFLINDLNIILPKIVKDSTKSIAFARTFGKNGQLLKPMLEQIKQKYDDLTLTQGNKIGFGATRQSAAEHETGLVIDSIDAYFDRFGNMNVGKAWTNSIGLLTMMSNLNMLGRVTISSLGDIIQPFQNSRTWTAAIRGMAKTNLFKASWEKGLARNLNYDFTNEMSRSLAKSAASDGKELMLSGAWQGKWGVKNVANPQFVNNLAFKGLGLEWLTGYARRFAYNAGASDAYLLSRKYFQAVSKNGANSRQAKVLQKELLETYELTANKAMTIGKGKTFNTAIKNDKAKQFLNESGLKASNRDALIPQVDNRLLFTQSKDPRIRMLGQFLSWSQAKSAQTNKILQRVESGDVRTLIKLLASIPVFSGIQQLREYAKYGDVITDAEFNGGELTAKAYQLSGMPGWLSDLAFNRFVGPGAKQSPFYVFAPALNMLTNVGDVGIDWLTGKKDTAWQNLDKRILPLPNWRNWVRKMWFPKGISTGKSSGSSTKASFRYGGVVRKKFNEGDYATSDMGYVSSIKEIKKDLNEKPKVAVENINNEILNDEVPNQTVETKKDIIPKKKPAYGDGEFINYIKKVENDPLRLGLTKKVIHKSAEGGNDTVAYGHKLTDKEKETGMVYGYDINNLSKEQQNDILIRDLQKADKELTRVYGDAYLKLDKRKKQMLIDFQFNMGSGGVEKFKNFRDGLFNNDETKMEKEYERGYTNEKDKFIKLDDRNNQFYNFFFKKKFNIGGLAAKGLTKIAEKTFVNRGKTAITSTKGTYTKANKIFNDLKKEKIHDFGSGKGVGSNEFKNKIVTSHEPFVPSEEIIKAKGKLPNYKTADEVILNDGLKSKDGIVNLNVLNVIESPADRIKVVDQIGKLLNDDGVAIITTRSAKDVINQAKKSKNAKEYLDGWLFGKGKSLTFQKGFGQKELEDYIKAILGKNFKVEKIPSKYDIKTTGILIKKLKEELV